MHLPAKVKMAIIILTEIDLKICIEMIETFSSGMTEFSQQTDNFHPCTCQAFLTEVSTMVSWPFPNGACSHSYKQKSNLNESHESLTYLAVLRVQLTKFESFRMCLLFIWYVQLTSFTNVDWALQRGNARGSLRPESVICGMVSIRNTPLDEKVQGIFDTSSFKVAKITCL